MERINPTRGLAVLLVGAVAGYEAHTLRVQARTRDTEFPRNDTWSQITRDIPFLDTLVGRAVFAAGLKYACEWFIDHVQEGSTSDHSVLHRQAR